MILVELVAVLFLILVNGLLAMSELAVVTSRKARLQGMAEAGSARARAALRLKEDPTRFLSTVQIGITLVGVLAGALSGATIAERLGRWLDGFSALAPYGNPIALALVVLAITYLSLVFGELAPKSIALRQPERIGAALAPIMQSLARVATPAVWLLKASTDRVLGALGFAGKPETAVTEEEVRLLLAEGTRAGVFAASERDMIEGVLRLADRRARALMTPRSEVAWLDERASPQDIAATLEESKFSRYPVCRGSLDQPVGVVQMKDLVAALLQGKPISLPERMVPPLVVLETVPVLKLLEMFRSEGSHMAIVVDEYGTTEGVVTLADILEGITGELPERGEELDLTLTRRDDGTWLVDGAFPVDEFEDRVGLHGLRDGGEFETMAGFVLHHMGRLPNVGESFTLNGARFEVIDMDGRRIDKILFSPAAQEYDSALDAG